MVGEKFNKTSSVYTTKMSSLVNRKLKDKNNCVYTNHPLARLHQVLVLVIAWV